MIAGQTPSEDITVNYFLSGKTAQYADWAAKDSDCPITEYKLLNPDNNYKELKTDLIYIEKTTGIITYYKIDAGWSKKMAIQYD